MIRAVIIDDERPAIKELEYLLKDNSAIQISGTYTNPLKAIDEIDKLMPQVLFLDINMPQMKGMDQLHNGIYYIRKTLQEYGVESHQIVLEKSY